MVTLKLAVRANQSLLLPPLLVATYVEQVNSKEKTETQFEDADSLDSSATIAQLTKGGNIFTNDSIIPELLKDVSPTESSRSESAKEWVGLTNSGGTMDLTILDNKTLDPSLQGLDSHLTLRSHIVGYSLTAADVFVWGTLRGNKIAYAKVKKANNNIQRWFNYINDTNPWLAAAVTELNSISIQKKAVASSQGGSYDIGLSKVEGGVVTRFPPEPSGYLHIGHAKAALLNDHFAHEKSDGTLICRFDDTNPSKESQEYQDTILADLELMKIHPNKVTYSSDYFQQMYESCLQLLENGKAYADDTEREQMQAERREGVPSKRRETTIAENIQHFEEMKSGSEEGLRWCIRAKISVDDTNKALRDPVIYRCNLQPHHRTGKTWNIYPSYDLCAPFLDSLEGVTHALRTNEYRDRNPQYAWIQKALGIREVEVFDFARMNFVRTVLSKRKLTKLVEMGVVSGWDDPRMPTVRGILRRGMTMDALREFMIKEGPSSNIITQDWSKPWAINKKFIDPVSARHTAMIEKDLVEAHVRGAREMIYSEDKPKHGKNPDLGTKSVVYGKSILIDQDDAKTFEQDEEITLMNWGNAIVRKINGTLNPLNNKVQSLELELHLQGDFKKTKKKITWLAKEQELIPVDLVDFDHLITKDKLEKDDRIEDLLTKKTEVHTEAVADCNVATLQEGDIIQFERRGYFRIDKPFLHGKRAVAFEIPTGRTK